MNQDIVTAHPVGDDLGVPVKTLVARRERMLQIMKSVMEVDKHYGKIPGCGDKPALLKPGAETLLVSFMLSPKHSIQDLSKPTVSKYLVTVDVFDTRSGLHVASGSGSCSSDEEKYKWRAAVNDREFEETPEDQKRLKWKKRWENGKQNTYQIKQVRMIPADIDNTILKMAVKRATVAGALAATGASELFTQDLEDMEAEIAEAVTEAEEAREELPVPAPVPQPREKAAIPTSPVQAPRQINPQTSREELPLEEENEESPKVTEKQAMRFYAIALNEGGRNQQQVKDYLKSIGCNRTTDIRVNQYDAAIAWAQGK